MGVTGSIARACTSHPRRTLVAWALAMVGDASWYLPRWLSWSPRVRVESAG